MLKSILLNLDRFNGSYDLHNCVPCCPVCNYMKHTLTQNEFYKHILKIVEHLSLSSTTISKESTIQANGIGNGEGPEMDQDIVSSACINKDAAVLNDGDESCVSS